MDYGILSFYAGYTGNIGKQKWKKKFLTMTWLKSSG